MSHVVVVMNGISCMFFETHDMLDGRPCGTSTRAADRWTKDEVHALASKAGVPATSFRDGTTRMRTMNNMCSNLSARPGALTIAVGPVLKGGASSTPAWMQNITSMRAAIAALTTSQTQVGSREAQLNARLRELEKAARPSNQDAAKKAQLLAELMAALNAKLQVVKAGQGGNTAQDITRINATLKQLQNQFGALQASVGAYKMTHAPSFSSGSSSGPLAPMVGAQSIVSNVPASDVAAVNAAAAAAANSAQAAANASSIAESVTAPTLQQAANVAAAAANNAAQHVNKAAAALDNVQTAGAQSVVAGHLADAQEAHEAVQAVADGLHNLAADQANGALPVAANNALVQALAESAINKANKVNKVNAALAPSPSPLNIASPTPFTQLHSPDAFAFEHRQPDSCTQLRTPDAFTGEHCQQDPSAKLRLPHFRDTDRDPVPCDSRHPTAARPLRSSRRHR